MDENKNKRKEVEEYIEGELYHCNSYCDLNSNIHILLSGRYLNPCLDFSSGKAIGSIFLPESSKYYNLIKRFNADVIKSLGCIQKTVFHLEFFITPKEELVFLEIAARAPGGLLSKAATHSLGVDIEAINFNFQIDANHYSPKLSCASGNYAFWCWVPKQLGKRCETRRAERGRVDKVGEAERMAPRMCRRRGSKSVLKLYYLAVKAYRS